MVAPTVTVATLPLLAGESVRAIVVAMPELPRGTVTLLFTDIEGSTRMLQQLGRERYVQALETHRRLLRSAFQGHGGVEVEMQGDSFHVAFASAREAVLASAEAQRALESHEWESEPIRVRIGLHTGEPVVVDNLYAGLDVHRAARVMAAGHGGQVLLSGATQRRLDSDVVLVDLGEHRLKDLLQPERLYQLQIEGLPSEFPALKTLGNRPTNLLVQPTALIGRERELREIVGLLRREEVRLLSLTGTGGTGKTRLALEAGAELLKDFRSGVFFVSLAPIRDSGLVLPTIAQALSLREVPGEELPDTLAAYLEQKQMLLVLDNFEQVIDAAIDVAVLLRRCPKLKLVVTSRERLRVASERVYEVPPMRLPEDDLPPESLLENEAVMLFGARARAATSTFTANEENAALISAICRRVEGLPLAIELAAARAAALSPEALLRGLEQRLELLTGGARDAEQRQRTLRDTIEWSYNLLSVVEQQLFVRLGVFVDGCRLEAAEAVCGVDDLAISVLDVVQSLVEKSLLRQRADSDGEPRFWMLETIREYAGEQLAHRIEADTVAERHAQYFLEFAVKAQPQLQGPDQLAWLRRLTAEQENLREALAYASRTSDSNLKLRLCGALSSFWIEHALSEGSRWFDEALSVRDGIDPHARAIALQWAAFFPLFRGDLDTARRLAEEAIEACTGVGDKRGVARAMNALSFATEDQKAGRRILEASIPLFEEVEDGWGLSRALSNLGFMMIEMGEYVGARQRLEHALSVAAERSDWETVAQAQENLALIDVLVGDDEAASARLAECVAVFEEAGNSLALAASFALLARIAARGGDLVRAAGLLAAFDELQENAGFRVEGSEGRIADEVRGELASVAGKSAGDKLARSR